MYKTTPYFQRLTEKIPFADKIIDIAVVGENEFYACTEKGLCKVKNGVQGKYFSKKLFTKIYANNKGRVLAASENTVYAVKGEKVSAVLTCKNDVCEISMGEKVYVVTNSELYEEKENGFVALEIHPIEQTPNAMAVSGDRVCLSSEHCIQRMEGKRRTWRCIFHVHSSMPEIEINDIEFDKIGNLLVGADSGLYIYDYKCGWYSKNQIMQLPEEKINAIRVCDNGEILLGTDAGAILLRNGTKKYLPAGRYAFNTNVTAVDYFENSFYTVSDGGVVKISEVEMTLEEKARHFFEETEKYFPRKDGFVTWLGKPGEEVSYISDNDGLWTQMYLAALCMCYSITKDKKILTAARKYKDAMLVLMRATGIKGFTARAVRYPGEPGWGEDIESGGLGREWHRSPDGSYEWLGETSSDEMSGHYLGFALYYDLCANEKEKKEICKAICDITDHIMEHDGYLCDCDNLPTSWACWNEDALNNDSMWMWEKGVNSLEMLNFLKITYHMSGDEKYNEKYQSLIKDHHFHINAAYHKRADGHTCHIDDNLAMINTLTYLRLENDSAVRQYILMGLAHHYNYEKIEGNPFFGFIYKAFTGEPCDIDSCVKNLQDFPYEMERNFFDNSNRKDIELDDEPVQWGAEPRIKEPLHWDERHLSRLNLNPFSISSKTEDVIQSGMDFLFMYWLGRFLGVIE